MNDDGDDEDEKYNNYEELWETRGAFSLGVLK